MITSYGLVQLRVTAAGGWGRRPEVDAPGGPRATPGLAGVASSTPATRSLSPAITCL